MLRIIRTKLPSRKLSREGSKRVGNEKKKKERRKSMASPEGERWMQRKVSLDGEDFIWSAVEQPPAMEERGGQDNSSRL